MSCPADFNVMHTHAGVVERETPIRPAARALLPAIENEKRIGSRERRTSAIENDPRYIRRASCRKQQSRCNDHATASHHDGGLARNSGTTNHTAKIAPDTKTNKSYRRRVTCILCPLWECLHDS